MKRAIWALGIGSSLGLIGSTFAQEVEWRAVGSPKAPPITQIKAQTPPAPLADPMPLPSPSPLVTPMPAAVDPTTPAPKSAPPAPTSPEKLSSPKPLVTDGTMIAPPLANGATVDFPSPPVTDCMTCSPQFTFGGPMVGVDQRFYVRGEYLGWWLKGQNYPPLLTTTTTPIPVIAAFPNVIVIDPTGTGTIGSLGDPNARVLLGGGDLNNQFRSGVRLGAGWWFDPCGNHGIDGSIFYTGRSTERYEASQAGFPRLFRPFTAPNTGVRELNGAPGPFREIVAANELALRGTFVAESRSEFWGADLNYRAGLMRGCTSRVDAFAGFRFLSLEEDLTIIEQLAFSRSLALPTPPPNGLVLGGTSRTIFDRFSTVNRFYGGQVGVDAEWQRDRWSFGVRPSIALGATHEQLNVKGVTVQTVPGTQPVAATGGLLALNSNIGHRSQSSFAYVPEVTFRVGYQFSDRWKATLGYDFLYWSRVIRPADQIDTVLDTTQIPFGGGGNPINQARPAPLFNETDFWAQGVNAGLEYRW